MAAAETLVQSLLKQFHYLLVQRKRLKPCSFGRSAKGQVPPIRKMIPLVRLNLEESCCVSGKSDDFVVPTKLANKAGTPVAESMEGTESPKSSCVRIWASLNQFTNRRSEASIASMGIYSVHSITSRIFATENQIGTGTTSQSWRKGTLRIWLQKKLAA